MPWGGLGGGWRMEQTKLAINKLSRPNCHWDIQGGAMPADGIVKLWLQRNLQQAAWGGHKSRTKFKLIASSVI